MSLFYMTMSLRYRIKWTVRLCAFVCACACVRVSMLKYSICEHLNDWIHQDDSLINLDACTGLYLLVPMSFIHNVRVTYLSLCVRFLFT